MKNRREKVRLSIQPFIYKFKSKDGNQEREEVDLMKHEIKTAKTIFEQIGGNIGAFVLFGNHFSWIDDQMRVPMAPLTKANYIDIFIDRSTTPATAGIDSDKQIIPMAFVILNRDNKHTIPQKETGKFSKFDFLKKDGVWSYTELVNTGGKDSWKLTELKDSSPELESKDLLEKHIFSPEGEAATTTPALFTNFIQTLFHYELLVLLGDSFPAKAKLSNILYKNNNGKVAVTFDNIKGDSTLEESMRGKYNIVVECKESFNDDVLLTSVNPFKKTAYEPTTTSTITTTSSSSITTKKERMSTLMIGLIGGLVFVALIGIGFFGWYYSTKKRNASKRNKRLK